MKPAQDLETTTHTVRSMRPLGHGTHKNKVSGPACESFFSPSAISHCLSLFSSMPAASRFFETKVLHQINPEPASNLLI
jgi:hypothetical protein